MTSARGRFIVLEGGEGSGKTTQARLLADRLGAVLTREPGGTPLGEQIRRILLDTSLPEMGIKTEILLFAAARAQHVNEVIRPALAAGRDVVCDRYIGSSVAYQGYGRGGDHSVPQLKSAQVTPLWVQEISRWATTDLDPDLTVLLSVPSHIRAERLASRDVLDRVELAGEAFHARVEAGFASQAAVDPKRWRTVDGSGPVDTVTERIAQLVTDFFAANPAMSA